MFLKNTPLIRRQLVINDILKSGRLPSIKELSEKHKVSEVTVKRDLKAIRQELPKELMKEIHEVLLFNLKRMAVNNELKPQESIKLLEFFSPKKQQTEFKGDGTLKIELWQPVKHDEKQDEKAGNDTT